MPANAQCYGSLAVSPGFFEYDYLVRLAVHFGGADDIPRDIICSRERYSGEEIVEVPIWFYNASAGIVALEFSVESNDSLLGFTPNSGWGILSASAGKTDASIYQLNLKLDTSLPACGPGLVGWALVRPAPESGLTWINLLPNRLTSRMSATDGSYTMHSAFSPHHGGFIGSSWLYTCQEPICEEPNEPVVDFTADAEYGRWVRIAWRAGSGNVTVVRARLDRYPAGYGDGRLVVEVPTTPGQSRVFYDTQAPLGTLVYYTAFSLTKQSGIVTLDSFIECSAVDTAMTSTVIATESSSWGAIKKLMR